MQVVKKNSILFICLIFLLSNCSEEQKLGCTDPRSMNYDSEATIDNGECVYSDSYIYSNPEVFSDPDEDGNLIVMNESHAILHLYVNEAHKKVIPPRANNFLIDIQSSNEKDVLDIYKVAEVHDVTAPDAATIFKKWVVLLPDDNQPENRLKWVISEYATSDGNGTVRFTYSGSYQYNVDVFLQSKSGAYLKAFTPGSGYATSIDYGVYKFYYRYWSSSSGNSSASNEIGWLESPYVVLNAGTPELNIEIPGFNTVPAEAAQLAVVNQLDEPFNVYWGDRLIEDIVYGYENAEGMSALSPGHEALYYLDEGSNDVRIQNFAGAWLHQVDDITLLQNVPAKIYIGGEVMDAFASNKTTQTLYFGIPEYTGVSIASNAEKFIKLPETDSLTIFSADSSYFKELIYTGQSLLFE